MSLTSAIYRMAPSEGYVSKDEGERRLKAKIRRLVAEHGQERVLERIRRWPCGSKGDELLKAWLVLTVYATEARRAGSF